MTSKEKLVNDVRDSHGSVFKSTVNSNVYLLIIPIVMLLLFKYEKVSRDVMVIGVKFYLVALVITTHIQMRRYQNLSSFILKTNKNRPILENLLMGTMSIKAMIMRLYLVIVSIILLLSSALFEHYVHINITQPLRDIVAFMTKVMFFPYVIMFMCLLCVSYKILKKSIELDSNVSYWTGYLSYAVYNILIFIQLNPIKLEEMFKFIL